MDEQKLEWTIREYIGSEITKVGLQGAPLLKHDDIKVGDSVLVPSAAQGVYWLMKVLSINDDTAIAEDAETVSLLKFAEDDRKAWVSACVCNTRGLSRINFT